LAAAEVAAAEAVAAADARPQPEADVEVAAVAAPPGAEAVARALLPAEPGAVAVAVAVAVVAQPCAWVQRVRPAGPVLEAPLRVATEVAASLLFGCSRFPGRSSSFPE
jgi:hypothetical protein